MKIKSIKNIIPFVGFGLILSTGVVAQDAGPATRAAESAQSTADGAYDAADAMIATAKEVEKNKKAIADQNEKIDEAAAQQNYFKKYFSPLLKSSSMKFREEEQVRRGIYFEVIQGNSEKPSFFEKYVPTLSSLRNKVTQYIETAGQKRALNSFLNIQYSDGYPGKNLLADISLDGDARRGYDFLKNKTDDEIRAFAKEQVYSEEQMETLISCVHYARNAEQKAAADAAKKAEFNKMIRNLGGSLDNVAKIIVVKGDGNTETYDLKAKAAAATQPAHHTAENRFDDNNNAQTKQP